MFRNIRTDFWYLFRDHITRWVPLYYHTLSGIDPWKTNQRLTIGCLLYPWINRTASIVGLTDDKVGRQRDLVQTQHPQSQVLYLLHALYRQQSLQHVIEVHASGHPLNNHYPPKVLIILSTWYSYIHKKWIWFVRRYQFHFEIRSEKIIAVGKYQGFL